MTYAQAEEATAFICSVASCGEIATVLVEHAGTSERPLCPEHWHEACAAVPSVLTVSRILPRPLCFVRNCRSGAVEIVRHIDGTLLPCCEQHLNDLSWVVPEQVGS